MQLQITGKNIDIGDALKTHITDRLNHQVGRFFDDDARGTVTLMREGPDFRVDCSIHLRSGILLQAKGQSGDVYACFDIAADRLEKRLRRYNRRLKDHPGGKTVRKTIEASSYVIDVGAIDEPEESDFNPPIIAENTTQISELTVGDAVMRLDIAEAPFLFFKNASHGGLNVVYRREDGNLGWIDPGSGSKRGQA